MKKVQLFIPIDPAEPFGVMVYDSGFPKRTAQYMEFHDLESAKRFAESVKEDAPYRDLAKALRPQLERIRAEREQEQQLAAHCVRILADDLKRGCNA